MRTDATHTTVNNRICFFKRLTNFNYLKSAADLFKEFDESNK